MASLRKYRPLGEAIAKERRSKGLGQKEVVDLVESYYSDERSYRRIESGENLPERHKLIAILVSGLSINKADKINSILALGGYGLTQKQLHRLGEIV